MKTASPVLQDVRLTNFDKETTYIFQQEFEKVFAGEAPKLGLVTTEKVDLTKEPEEEKKEEVLNKKAVNNEGNENLELNKLQSKETASSEEQIISSQEAQLKVVQHPQSKPENLLDLDDLDYVDPSEVNPKEKTEI